MQVTRDTHNVCYEVDHVVVIGESPSARHLDQVLHAGLGSLVLPLGCQLLVCSTRHPAHQLPMHMLGRHTPSHYRQNHRQAHALGCSQNLKTTLAPTPFAPMDCPFFLRTMT